MFSMDDAKEEKEATFYYPPGKPPPVRWGQDGHKVGEVTSFVLDGGNLTMHMRLDNEEAIQLLSQGAVDGFIIRPIPARPIEMVPLFEHPWEDENDR